MGIDEEPLPPLQRRPPPVLLQLPDEVLGLILLFLLPPSQATTFPPRHPRSSSYTDLSQSWTCASVRPPWPHPAVPRALCAFALVSRRANQLATPLLYHAIHLHTIVATNQLANTLDGSRHKGSLVRHLHLPNDGLLHGASDRMADKQRWVESIRIILHSAFRLESLSLATRPGGEVLQEVLSHACKRPDGMETLRRLTVSSLSFSFPSLGVGRLNARQLSHLHLIQWIPPTLSERFGATIYQSLQAIRLSRIPSSAVRIAEALDGGERRAAQHIFDESIRSAPQPLLLLLRECIEQCCELKTVLLEMEQQADLDVPDTLRPWVSEEHLDGQEEAQCEQRQLYWSQIEQFKHLLTRYSHEMALPIDFRIVAPRTLGWDRNESLIDFHANAAACRGEPDCSAFQDEDVFELVRKHPHLGYDYANDQAGNMVAYWTGALPRNAR